MSFLRLFHDKTFNKKLLMLAIPIAIQNLMLAFVAAGDAVMLGKVSQNAMAAVSLATLVQFVQNMFLFGFTSGASLLGAQYWGKKDIPVMEKIFGICVQNSVLVSLLFFIGCYFYPHKLMLLFAQDPQLLQLGAEYLKVASWSYLLTGISQCYLMIMRVSDHVSRSAWISSGAVIMNIVFNAFLIFGLCGLPAMGVRGAAAATVLARIIELLWCIGSSLQKNFIRLHLKNLFIFSKTLIADFWHYSLPILGACLLWGTGFTAYSAFMGHLGPDAAAANAIAAVARELICCICNGLGNGVAILIGNELGAGHLLRGKIYGIRAMLLSFINGFGSTAVILAVIPIISCTMKLTPQAHKYMVGMFIILAFYMIGRCICTIVINGIFSAGGDTLFDVYSLTVCMWCIALPCAVLGTFVFHWHVLVVYACTCLDEVGKVPWVIHHFARYKWVRNITRD